MTHPIKAMFAAVAILAVPALVVTEANANPACEAKALDKNGKKLAGAAKAAFVKKCSADSAAKLAKCEAKALDKNGKKLAGAAKNAVVKKCMGG